MIAFEAHVHTPGMTGMRPCHGLWHLCAASLADRGAMMPGHTFSCLTRGRAPRFRTPTYFPMQNLEIGRKPLSFLGLRAGRTRMCTCTCTRRG